MLIAGECGVVAESGEYYVSEAARGLYENVAQGTWWRRAAAFVMGRPMGLRALPNGMHPGSSLEGVQTVPIARIQGSENRCRDFDTAFHPLVNHNQERWLSVAMARLRGRNLPPVELIRVSDTYYVRDGHHRISVARALGEEFIEASVMVWEN
jgi:hypothetical protein